MASKRISDLPAETDPSSTDVVAIDGATTRKTTRANLLKENLEAIRGLTSAADKGIQFTGAGTAAVYDLTSAGKALLDDTDAATQRVTLGLVIGTDVQAYDSNLNGFDPADYATAAQGTAADSAVQPGDLGALALKDTIAVSTDITATGVPSATTYLRGDGSWQAIVGGAGDMLAATYDPSTVAGDAFDSTNHSFLQSGTGAIARSMRDKARDFVSVKDFGAKGDGVVVTATVSITSGTAALTATGAAFTALDVGKVVVVPGAGTSGGELVAIISAFTDAANIVLDTSASTTLSAVSKVITYGTDDAAALNDWLAHLSANAKTGYLPSGNYTIASALNPVLSSSTDMSLTYGWGAVGAGEMSSTVTYVGSNNVNDIIVIGDGTNYYYKLRLSGFRITSATRMQGGYALRLRKQRDFHICVSFDFLNLDNLDAFVYNAIYFDACEYGFYVDSTIGCRNDGITASLMTGLWLDAIKIIYPGNDAIHYGGSCGGIYHGYVEIFGAQTGIRVDTALVAGGNNQFFFSLNNIVDTCAQNGYYLDDALSTFKDLIMHGWGCSSQSGNHGFVVNNWKDGTVSFAGARFISNTGSGVYINDASTNVLLDSTCRISENTSAGINGVATSKLYCDAFPVNNGTDFGANYRAGSGAFNAAWSSYSAAVTAGSGTLTSASATVTYAIRGKRVDVQVTITITNNGTGGGSLNVAMPAALSTLTGACAGREVVTSGNLVAGSVQTGSMAVVKYDNSYPAASGSVIRLGGVFELL